MNEDISIILAEYREKFPLFKFETKGASIEVEFSSGSKRIFRSINEINSNMAELEVAHSELKYSEELGELYPNLYISKYGVWAIRGKKSNKNSAFFAVTPPGIFDFKNLDHNFLYRINKAAEKAVKDPKNWLFCSRCNDSIERDSYAGQVFMAHYCITCAAECNEIAALIESAKKPGFYD